MDKTPQVYHPNTKSADSPAVDYIETYYSKTITSKATPYSRLTSQIDVDCCVIGAGIAGLSVAAELTKQGMSVAVLESHRIAWGASGRNGGFVSPGFALSYPMMCKAAGHSQARELYKLSIEGMHIIRDNIKTLKMNDVLQSEGELDVIRHRDNEALWQKKHYSERDFNLKLDVLDTENLKQQIHSDCYYGAILNKDAFQIHPLNYCIRLAAYLAENGVQIYEQSRVEYTRENSAGKFTVKTAHGEVNCKQLIHCTGGYTGNLNSQLKRSLFPILTHVMLSQALGEKRATALSTQSGVLDDRRASDYFRVVQDERLLWGGHITTIEPSQYALEKEMKKRLQQVFPQLAGTRTDISWSGKMAYSRHKMPFVGKLKNGAWVCTAFGGHGLNTASISGYLVARAIACNDERYRLFAPFGLTYNFGLAGKAAVQLSYWKYQLQDWWKESRSRASNRP